MVLGNRNLLSEELVAYEAGVRGQPTDRFTWDLAVFFNDYARLTDPVPVGMEMSAPGRSIIIPTVVLNAVRGDTYGFELASSYKITEAWQVRAAYSFLVMDMQPFPGTPPPTEFMGQTPRNELYLHSTFDLGRHWELDLIGRYVDNLPTFGVSKYIVGDVRSAWRPQPAPGTVGRGSQFGQRQVLRVWQRQHPGAVATEVVPEVYAQVAWRY